MNQTKTSDIENSPAVHTEHAHKPTIAAFEKNNEIEVKESSKGQKFISILLTASLFILVFFAAAAIVYFFYGRSYGSVSFLSPLP